MVEIDFLQMVDKANFYIVSPSNIIKAQVSFVLVLPKFQRSFLKGIFLYFHPTILSKTDGPSSLHDQFLSIGSLMASQGFATVATDYIGYRNSKDFAHPYLIYPKPNIESMLHALQSSFPILVERYGNQVFDIFPFGYSEGATYSLLFSSCWLSRDCKDFNPHPGFRLAKSAAADGAFNLAQTQYNFLREDINSKSAFKIQNARVTTLVKPSITSFLAYSFQYYNPGNARYNISNSLNFPFFLLQCSQILQRFCDIGGVKMNIRQAFQSSGFNTTQIAQAIGFGALGKVLNQRKYSTATELTDPTHNSIDALVKTDLLQSEQFLSFLKDADLVLNKKLLLNNERTYIFTLSRDSVVVPENAHKLRQTLPYSVFYSFNNNNYHVCDSMVEFPVDHLRGEIIAVIFSLGFFIDK